MINTDVAHCDETGMKINSQLYWLHSVATPDWTFYACHPKREQEAIDEIGILPPFKGTTVHDF